jgi:hypothetical protein
MQKEKIMGSNTIDSIKMLRRTRGEHEKELDCRGRIQEEKA